MRSGQGYSLGRSRRFRTARSAGQSKSHGWAGIAAAWFLLGCCPDCGAQLVGPEAAGLAEARAEFQAAEAGLRDAIRTAGKARTALALSSLDTGEAARKKWIESIHATNPARLRLEQAAEALFRLDPGPTVSLWQLLFQSLDRAFQSKRMGKSHRLASLLNDRLATAAPEVADKKNREFVEVALGVSALYVGDVETARAFAKTYEHELKKFSQEEIDLIDQLDYTAAVLAEEKQRQSGDRNLPRVRIETALGPFEIELFEDDAPRAVNQFVGLVESGFYDRTVFHAVLPGVFSQGGLFGDDRRPKPPQPTIVDELNLPTARKHVYGSFSLARTDKPNSASSPFTIAWRSDPEMNARQTVIGRVISGMDVVEELEPTLKFGEEDKIEEVAGANPSTLVKAVVLEKRDHPYGIPGKPVSADNQTVAPAGGSPAK